MGAQPGEAAGDDGDSQHDRQVNDQPRRGGDGDGGSHLPDAVRHGSQCAGHPQLPGVQYPPQGDGNGDGTKPAGAGIQDRTEIPGEYRPQKDPAEQHRRGFRRADDEHGEHRDDVGKSQLDPRDGNQRGELSFHHKNSQGNGGEQCQKHQFFRFHFPTAFLQISIADFFPFVKPVLRRKKIRLVLVFSPGGMYNRWETTIRQEEIYMKYGFGVDLGGTTVKLAWFDETGELLDKWEIPTVTADGGKQILPDIAAAINGYLERKGISKEQVIGIGLGVPGPVSAEGVVNRCVNLGWGVFNIHDELSGLTGLKVRAGNDANVAALGEAWKGGGNGCENMIMATLGTGVGGGIIVDGKPHYGVHGGGGEIGHLVLNKYETEPCGCGKYGCVEQYCSATGVVRLAKRHMALSARDSVLRSIDDLVCKDVFDAGKAGDPLALEILEQVYDYMGQFLANICCVVDPEIVVLGGGVSKAGQPLLDGAKRYFDKYIFHASKDVRFAVASLGNDAGAYGAFKLVLDAK